MKRLFMALPLALLTTAVAHAADPIEKQVQVTATVPTDAFYVEPVGGNWMNDPQELGWNSFRGELQAITKQLQVKSTVGPISAYLLSPAAITSGTNSIGLDIKVADTVLSTTSTEVVSQAQAAPGAVVGFEIAAQAAPSTGYVPGNYQGLVSMMFETAAPTP
ncbi:MULTISPECIES: CS1 type fimbrial major subunit [unclassified Pseudomonas]|uniref:CS1 type fimbrial major subunit n=1 Tax=unclassified Pseudomonas TaxID=196821 RepID=UPI00244C9EFE|nr:MULTISPECIES: CS1 type fimbrial major subunit [unclassified Pseudomonas]MDH0305075.1 fimbrial protein [Pseudomonas sp. GD04091]MDH1987041.1 fimbrial protein [Pseudomonas sp. GD03689]